MDMHIKYLVNVTYIFKMTAIFVTLTLYGILTLTLHLLGKNAKRAQVHEDLCFNLLYHLKVVQKVIHHYSLF